MLSTARARISTAGTRYTEVSNSVHLTNGDVHHAVRPGIAGHASAQGQKPAVSVDRELHLEGLIAALVIGGEGFAPLAGPFDRPADPLRRPNDQGKFRIECVPGPIIAADIARDHANRSLRHAKNAGKFALLPHRAAAAGKSV